MKTLRFFKILSLAFAIMIVNSCDESILDLQPNAVTEEAYFVEEIEFERAVLGIYAKMTDFYWYNGGQNSCVLPVTLLPGDDITTTGQEEFEIFSNINPASGRLSYFYSAIYQMIARANVVIEKVIAVEDGIYVTAGRKDAHLGEALFLRAYGHYLLWNIFGTAPVRNFRVKVIAEMNPTSSSGTELLDQAITDLTEAATLLPATWDAANRGRVTKNSANGLLGKALVFKGTITGAAADHQAAITAFDKIAGASLVANFDDNHAFDTENNAESLFEYQATQAFGFDNIWLSNDFDNAVGALSVYWGFYNNNFTMFGKPRFIATQKLADMYPVGDPRKALTLNPANNNIRKYVSRDRSNQGGSSSVNNPRILRYADILILKAEALNESNGSTVEAINLLNQVRTRARGAGVEPANLSTGITDRAQIRQLIMNERLMELAGEGERYFDLRRWALGSKITLNNAFFNSAIPTDLAFAAKHLNFPIPTSETDRNPNITQNEGY